MACMKECCTWGRLGQWHWSPSLGSDNSQHGRLAGPCAVTSAKEALLSLPPRLGHLSLVCPLLCRCVCLTLAFGAAHSLMAFIPIFALGQLGLFFIGVSLTGMGCSAPLGCRPEGLCLVLQRWHNM